MSDIDFVQLWVDGSDKDWQIEKGKYIPGYNADASAMRYRSWDNLQYWFRGVEKYAPWVRKIHLVTPGHFPKWLNKNHEKLNCINQNEFLKKEHIPVFNSNAVEINLHRIKSLADKFVLFCDDMFITNKVKETDFFKNNLPCDQAIMNNFVPLGLFSYIDFNNVLTINKHFNKKRVIKNNLLKWYNPIYGMQNISNILFYPWKAFSRFVYPHLPLPYLKKTFQEVWEVEEQLLDKTSQNRFRAREDVSHLLFRYWKFMKGEFCPSFVLGKKFDIFKNGNLNTQIYKAIVKQKYKMICVNEFEDDIDFDSEKQKLNKAFETIFPEKSSFEV
ncbi:MAG: stealth family protein [Fibromonadales bacterium]|nr:stealth family protein [Fibromonadales bacterium]